MSNEKDTAKSKFGVKKTVLRQLTTEELGLVGGAGHLQKNKVEGDTTYNCPCTKTDDACGPP
jgi:hypothetical protein